MTTNSSVCDHNSLIRRQFMKIESLENELALIKLERDSLLGENERLCFQLQMMSEAIKKQSNHSIKYDSSDGAIGCIDSHLSFIDTSNNRQSITTTTQQNSRKKYELSQQLLDKRLVALERKYGGQSARDAAIRIQRAFRTYRLKKRFQSIAIQALQQTQNFQHSNVVINSKRLSSVSSTTSSLINNDANNEFNNGFNDTNSATTIMGPEFELKRKRQYRVGLNLFNKHPPERGVQYLIGNGFIERHQTLELQALNIARFVLTRKGVSKAMIGEYISTNHSFNALVMKQFSQEIDLTGLSIDTALRKFQTFFRFPGEAQKIERLVDTFANRYIQCNPNEQLSRDSVFILSFAIIMLNTDLHAPTISSKSRMTPQQWVHNLKGVFSEGNLSEEFLLDIYQRVKAQEFRTGADHVTQVLKVQSAIVGKEVPNLCQPFRRLVCYCRLYEVRDYNKRERVGQHQREVFLFNDMLLITKLSSRAKSIQTAEYQYRLSIPLDGLFVQLFQTQHYLYGIRLTRKLDSKPVVMFNARNELDQKRFCDDLRESVAEMDEMEQLRIIKSNSLLQLATNDDHNNININNDMNLVNEQQLVTTTTQTNGQEIRRKSSSGSLDSGLSLPSRDHSPQQTNKSGEKVGVNNVGEQPLVSNH